MTLRMLLCASLVALTAPAAAAANELSDGYYTSPQDEDPYAFLHVYAVKAAPGGITSFKVDDQSGFGPGSPVLCTRRAGTALFDCYDTYSGFFDLSAVVDADGLAWGGPRRYVFASAEISGLPAVPVLVPGLYAGPDEERFAVGALREETQAFPLGDGLGARWSCRIDGFTTRSQYRCTVLGAPSGFDLAIVDAQTFRAGGVTFRWRQR